VGPFLLLLLGAAGELPSLPQMPLALPPPPPPPVELVAEPPPPPSWKPAAMVTAGFVTAFFAHETGHVVTNLLLGNSPHFETTTVLGFVPFPVISPRLRCDDAGCTRYDGAAFPSGRRGKFVIVTMGFDVQHALDELVLDLTPDLRYRDAPWRKGLLAFGILTSCLYSAAAMLGVEDSHGDLSGAASMARVNERLLALGLLAPAILDAYRYMVPSTRWAPWVSRAAKAGLVGMAFTF
jgi:hypothetical protein